MKRTSTATWLEKYNRWQIKVQKNGERKTFTCSTPGKKGQRACNEKADKWLENNISFTSYKASKAYDEWIEELKATTSTPHATQYKGYGDNHIKPIFKAKNIDDITEYDLQSIINTGYRKGLSKKTLTNIASCIRAFFKYCRIRHLTTLFPEGLKVPRQAYSKQRVILQPEDIKKLFSIDTTKFQGKIQYELYVNAYRFEVATGLRPGEVIGLQREDDTENKICIRRSINRFNEETTGKNANARRWFEKTDLVNQILDNQYKKLNELGIKSKYIFPNELGEHITQYSYYHRWVKYRDLAGISKASPYELRHTFVSIVKQLPEGLLKPLVGHSKSMDTYGIYSHYLDGDQDVTAEKVQSIFDKILEKK